MATQRDTYVLIPEVDKTILERLPKLGSKLGVKPLGKQVKALGKELKDVGLDSASINGRMTVLRHRGFVEKVIVMPVGGGPGYQITEDGERFIEAVNNGTYEEE